MGNYLVVLLLSVLVLLIAFYGYNVERKIGQIKDDFVNSKIQHRNEIKKVKIELESTRQQISARRKELIEKDDACRKEIKQMKDNVTTFKDEFVNAEIQHGNEIKKVKVELESMREQINTHRKEMIEKDNACRKEQYQIKENVITLHEETMMSLKETDNRFANTLANIQKGNKEHNFISFSARLGKPIADINPWDTVVFDQVIYSYNNFYNNSTGIFTALIAGTYYFPTTIFTKKGSLVELALKVNEKTEMWIQANAQTIPSITATNSIIVKLNKDNTVRIIKNGAHGSRPYYIHNTWSTFTGFLL